MELWKPEDMKEYVNFEVPKFLMMEDGDYLAMVEPKVKAAMGKISAIYRSDPFFLEVLPKGIDKAQSLERLTWNVRGTHERADDRLRGRLQ